MQCNIYTKILQFNYKRENLNKLIIFIINDFQGHGGHVRSFVSHLKNISNFYNFKIICSVNGFCSQHIKEYDFLNENNLIYFNFEKMNKYQYDFKFYKILNNLINDDIIIHTYSFEAIFMMSLVKRKKNNISTIVSVMGGLNPYPYLSIMDHYISVSEEQKKDAILYSDKSSVAESNISIIKNRIILDKQNKEVIKCEEQAILIVTRFDSDKLNSLEKIFKLVDTIYKDEKIIIAGDGSLLNEYKNKYKDIQNVEFLGFVKNLNYYNGKIKLVIGMGRSILEFMLRGKPAILFGYKGIEILDTLEKVKFASEYNFSGREIYENKSIINIQKHLKNSPETVDNSILNFLEKEYGIENYKEKYEKIVNNISSKEISYLDILKCYIHIFKIRLNRKLRK